ESSLRILDNLHARWVQLLTSLPEDNFTRFGINSQGEERSIDAPFTPWFIRRNEVLIRVAE
ncbi:MAG: hypothetical protein AAF560_17360, partial [Acidobacteriota bacterium]